MKLFKTILFLVLGTASLFAETEQTGTIITMTGETINIYKHPKKRKANFSKLPVGCDCSNQKYKFYYIDSEGNLAKIAEKEIKQLSLEKGTTYCKEYSSGRSPNGLNINQELPEGIEMRALPSTARGKKLVLQTILASNEKYMLSLFSNEAGNGFVNICDKNGKPVKMSMSYLGFGLGKKGAADIQAVKKYFKDCEKLLNIIDENVKRNKAAKRRMEQITCLYGVSNVKCE